MIQPTEVYILSTLYIKKSLTRFDFGKKIEKEIKKISTCLCGLLRPKHFAWAVIHLYCTFCILYYFFFHSNFKSLDLFSEIPSKINPSKKSDPSAVCVIKRRENLLYTKFNF